MRVQFKFNRSLRRELAPGDRRLWILRAVALRIERHANPLWVFEVYHRRLILTLCVFGVVSYLAAATALYAWLARQPYNQVGWTDIAAPWHWRELRARRGDTAIAAGQAFLREQNYPDAFYQLRVGLARSPGNLEGRLTLFRLFAGYDPTRALSLLEDGLAYQPKDPKLVGTLLDFYAHLQAEERALATVERLLVDGADSAVRPRLLRTRLALLMERGRLVEAEKALASLPASAANDGADPWVELRLEFLRRVGRTETALPLVAAVLANDQASVTALRQIGELAVAREDAALLQSVIRRLRAREPEAPGPYLFAIQTLFRMRQLTRQEGYVREYLQFFSRNESALQALAALGVSLGQSDLVKQARQVALQSGYSPFAFQVHLTELALRRGDTDAAITSLRDWEKNIETLDPRQRFHPELIRRLTRAAFAGTPDQTAAVIGLLAADRRQAQLPVYTLADTVLEQANQLEAAGQVVRAGLQVFPSSEPMLAASRRLEEHQVQASRAAAADPAQAGAGIPGTGPETMAQLDRLLATAALADARDLVRAVRAANPVWLPVFDEALNLREVELACLALEPLAGRAVAQAYLDRFRTEESGLRLVALVERLLQQDRSAAARLLADELLASPTATAAVRQALGKLALSDDATGEVATQAAALAALDRYLAAADWVSAERLLRLLDDQPPAWLEAGFIEVKIRTVLLRLGLAQRPLALAALKELAVRSGAARSAAFKLVRDLLARGEQEHAKVLAREILRLLPGNPAAERLVQEAEAPREN